MSEEEKERVSVYCPLCGRIRMLIKLSRLKRISACRDCSRNINAYKNSVNYKINKKAEIIKVNGCILENNRATNIKRPDKCVSCKKYRSCLNEVVNKTSWNNWKVVKGGYVENKPEENENLVEQIQKLIEDAKNGKLMDYDYICNTEVDMFKARDLLMLALKDDLFTPDWAAASNTIYYRNATIRLSYK